MGHRELVLGHRGVTPRSRDVALRHREVALGCREVALECRGVALGCSSPGKVSPHSEGFPQGRPRAATQLKELCRAPGCSGEEQQGGDCPCTPRPLPGG